MLPLTLHLTLPRKDFNVTVNLHLPHNGITVLFGTSGAGKTTLLRGIAGLEHGRGLVNIGEEVWQDDTQNIFQPVWRRSLAYVFQEPNLLPHLDVQENLRYGLHPRRVVAHNSTTEERETTLNALMECLDLDALRHRHVQELSGGERQRVALARALARCPRLLLLDEPLSAVDEAKREKFLLWLLSFQARWHIPILYVTHSFKEAARVADTLVLMERGTIKAVGPLNEVLLNIEDPLPIGDEACSVIQGKIVEYDQQWHLIRVNIMGAHLWVSENVHRIGASRYTVGQSIRVRILARDVSLVLESSHTNLQTSIQNCLPCVISDIADHPHPAQTFVRICSTNIIQTAQDEATPTHWQLIATITRRSAHALNLKHGQPVWAQIKSVALLE